MILCKNIKEFFLKQTIFKKYFKIDKKYIINK